MGSPHVDSNPTGVDLQGVHRCRLARSGEGSQRILSSRWHDVFSARVKLSCPESVLKGCVFVTSVQYVEASAPKNETRDAG